LLAGCPVNDIETCMQDLSPLRVHIGQEAGGFGELGGGAAASMTTLMSPGHAHAACDAASSGDADKIIETMKGVEGDIQAGDSTGRMWSGEIECSTHSRLPDARLPACLPQNYDCGEMSDLIASSSMTAMDCAGGVASHDERLSVKEALAINDKCDGSGAGWPADYFVVTQGPNCHWPKAAPLTPRGTNEVSGTVSGLLCDCATPCK